METMLKVTIYCASFIYANYILLELSITKCLFKVGKGCPISAFD